MIGVTIWTTISLVPVLGHAQNSGPHDIDPTADIHPSVILEGKVIVGAYTKIDAGTVITGNVTIGHHSLVRCNVTIRGTNTIGICVHIYDNVCIEGGRPAKIGSSIAEVPDKSIIGDHCWINHGATMHGTQMADRSAVNLNACCDYNTRLGEGAVLANLNEDGTGSSLAWSEDRAATWTWADWSFPDIGYPTWLNAGKNYAVAQDEFAYVYSPDTPSAYKTSDHILLARVRTSEIRNEKAYCFFDGLDDDGDPRWTANFEQRKPVITDPGHCYRPEVVFDPGIGKYLLLTATSGAPRWAGTDEKYLGIFEASTPWGPWHTVKQIHEPSDDGRLKAYLVTGDG